MTGQPLMGRPRQVGSGTATIYSDNRHTTYAQPRCILVHGRTTCCCTALRCTGRTVVARAWAGGPRSDELCAQSGPAPRWRAAHARMQRALAQHAHCASVCSVYCNIALNTIRLLFYNYEFHDFGLSHDSDRSGVRKVNT
jgi:hypothetical protein